ncbi:hypothetical protein H4R20_004435 [Coemansia guatemalensis]|uniref:Uncharacterized protein n=1 Tax=Coemansia guatemalensis TaxID=2761395 RepID=A0A9W8LSS5_9FUNG|nr:hypothetical protein H4R20_004435 [Coemansia guatemalensis]
MFIFSSTFARACQLAGSRFTSSHSLATHASCTTQTTPSVATQALSANYFNAFAVTRSALHTPFSRCAAFENSLARQQQVQREEVEPRNEALPIDLLLASFRRQYGAQLECEKMHLGAAVVEQKQQQQREVLEEELEGLRAHTDKFIDAAEDMWVADMEALTLQCKMVESEADEADEAALEEQQQLEALNKELEDARYSMSGHVLQRESLEAQLVSANEFAIDQKVRGEELKLKLEQMHSDNEKFLDEVTVVVCTRLQEVKQQWKEHFDMVERKYQAELDELRSPPSSPRTACDDDFEYGSVVSDDDFEYESVVSDDDIDYGHFTDSDASESTF